MFNRSIRLSQSIEKQSISKFSRSIFDKYLSYLFTPGVEEFR